LVHSNDDIHIEKAERSLVRKLCLLNSRKSERDKQGEFLAEGIKICSEILEGNVKVTLVLLSESFLENPVLSRRMVQKAVKKGIRMKRIDDRSFRRISGLKTDQGVLVRGSYRSRTISRIPSTWERSYVRPRPWGSGPSAFSGHALMFIIQRP
jgi:tRNA G18 (ribose-2'-O)-methylase SpoU